MNTIKSFARRGKEAFKRSLLGEKRRILIAGNETTNITCLKNKLSNSTEFVNLISDSLFSSSSCEDDVKLNSLALSEQLEIYSQNPNKFDSIIINCFEPSFEDQIDIITKRIQSKIISDMLIYKYCGKIVDQHGSIILVGQKSQFDGIGSSGYCLMAGGRFHLFQLMIEEASKHSIQIFTALLEDNNSSDEYCEECSKVLINLIIGKKRPEPGSFIYLSSQSNKSISIELL